MTRELRTILKDVLYQEMEHLEERLNDLEPKDRMQIILKLMPYVFPKVIDVQSTKDEPLDFGFINLAEKLYYEISIRVFIGWFV